MATRSEKSQLNKEMIEMIAGMLDDNQDIIRRITSQYLQQSPPGASDNAPVDALTNPPEPYIGSISGTFPNFTPKINYIQNDTDSPKSRRHETPDDSEQGDKLDDIEVTDSNRDILGSWS